MPALKDWEVGARDKMKGLGVRVCVEEGAARVREAEGVGSALREGVLPAVAEAEGMPVLEPEPVFEPVLEGQIRQGP